MDPLSLAPTLTLPLSFPLLKLPDRNRPPLVSDLNLLPWNAPDAAADAEIEADGWCRVDPIVLLRRRCDSWSADGGELLPEDGLKESAEGLEEGPRGCRIGMDMVGNFVVLSRLQDTYMLSEAGLS